MTLPPAVQAAADAKRSLKQSVDAQASKVLQACVDLNSTRHRHRDRLTLVSPDAPTVKTAVVRATG